MQGIKEQGKIRVSSRAQNESGTVRDENGSEEEEEDVDDTDVEEVEEEEED